MKRKRQFYKPTDHRQVLKREKSIGHDIVPGQVFPKKIIIYIMNKLPAKDAFYMGMACKQFLYNFFRYYKFYEKMEKNCGGVIRGNIKNTKTIKCLLENTCFDLSVIGGKWAIGHASENGYLGVVQLLLQDKRVDPSAANNWAIRLASENGHLEIVRLLLQDKRVDPSADNNYAIRYASQNGRLEVVKLLLHDKRVDPSAKNNWAIKWANGIGHSEIVSLLRQDRRVNYI